MVNLRTRWMEALLCAVLAAACGASDPGPANGAGASAPVSDETRRLALREELRLSLGESYDQPLPAVSEADLERGARMWMGRCASCHGPKGHGSTPLGRMLPVQPVDLADPEQAGFFSARANLWILSEGSPGTPMVAWKGVLDEASMRAVLAHMETLQTVR